MKNVSFFLFLTVFCVYFSFGQNNVTGPVVQLPVYFDVSPPLRDLVKNPPKKAETSWKDGIIKNRFNIRPKPSGQAPGGLTDPNLQTDNGLIMTDTTIINFEGNTNTQGFYPPDTYGEVGPNHYFQVVNCHFTIYSKTGTVLLGPLDNSSIFAGLPNNSNDGDAVVIYDEQADRWLFSQFSLPNYPNGPYYQMIALSQTADPTGSWYRYQYTFTDMPDYPKFGVWPDAYYMSMNRFAGNWLGTGAVAYDRTKMLAGDPTATMVMFTKPNSDEAYSWLPSDCDGTFPAGNPPNYFLYMFDGASNDHLGIYEFHVDWVTPANSTFGNFLSLPVNAFTTNINGIPQPGTSRQVDPLNDRMMYRLQYRIFSDHAAMVCNHTVDISSTVAGVRWYELRKTSGAWSIYQQSTFSIADNNCRWMGSMAMDTSGNIALGYSISSSSLYPSIRYTGRMKNDALNTMTIGERGIYNGSGSQTGSALRWGDYSAMSIDPSAPATFWYTQEYYEATSAIGWKTRIACFSFANRPIVVTQAATAVTSTGATLNGTVNPNGYATTYQFEWGTNTSYGFLTAVQSVGSGTSALAENITLMGLSPNQTYHYRIDATSSEGNAYGFDQSFTTSCGIVTVLPFSEGFESQASTPTCWSEENSNPAWLYIAGNGGNNPKNPQSGVRNACLEDNTTTDNTNKLILPLFDLSLYSNVILTFWHTQQVHSQNQDQLIVYYRTSSSGTWTMLASYTNSISSWTQETIALPNIGSYYQIAFEGNAKNGYGVCIDNITLNAPGIWVGGTPGNLNDWGIATNWSDGIVPGASTDVYIPLRANLPVITSTTAVCNNLVIESSAVLSVTATNKITVNGKMTLR